MGKAHHHQPNGFMISWIFLITATFTDGRRKSNCRTSRSFAYITTNACFNRSATNTRRSSIVSHLASLACSPSSKRSTIRRIVRISSRARRLVTDVRKELASDHPRKRRTCRRTLAVFVCFIDRITLLVRWLCLVIVQWKCWQLTFRDQESILSLLLFTAPVQRQLIRCSSTNSPT